MTIAQPEGFVVRAAREQDGPALAAFCCSSGVDWEWEVEDFVRDDALALALAPGGNFRLLIVSEDDRLVACCGHLAEAVFRGGGQLITATRLQLLALSLADQGRRLDDGRRLSDLVMQTLISDALQTREADVLTAIVARSNLRSIRLCERNGLRSQIRHDSRYIRLSGRFTLRASDG